VRRALVILAALLACGCSAPAGPAAPAVAAWPARLDTSRFLVGAAAASAAQFQRATGVQPAIVEHYDPFGTAFSPGFAGNAVPLIQLMPYGIPLASVTAGGEDSWLRSYAHAVAGYRRPVILGFAPEMNGSWYAWGDTHTAPAAYIAAWRHVVSVFRAQGAKNVTWLWTVNVQITVGDSHPSNGVAAVVPWWPGSAWVDWVGLDGYYYRSSETFGVVFGHTIARVRDLTRDPVLISETAVAPAAGKAVKIPALFAAARAARLAGLIWFDLPGNRDWRLEDNQAALAAFRIAAAGYR
jgi:mannan endo-1,4-beta-mannosidase